MESWVDIAEVNEIIGEEIYLGGYYEVSPSGAIRSIHRYKFQPYLYMQVLKTQINRDGYVDIKLKNSQGSTTHTLVHRIVAMLFLPNPDNLAQVDHKDGNKENNDVSNLQWLSKADNIKRNYTELGYEPWNKGKKLPSGEDYKGKVKPVSRFALDGTLEKEYFSAAAAEDDGYNRKSISACCRGKTKTYKNKLWEFT